MSNFGAADQSFQIYADQNLEDSPQSGNGTGFGSGSFNVANMG